MRKLNDILIVNPIVEGEWSTLEDAFNGWSGLREGTANGTILYVCYDSYGYEGSATVIFYDNGELYEAGSSHCSCNGLEWYGPERTVSAALLMRKQFKDNERFHRMLEAVTIFQKPRKTRAEKELLDEVAGKLLPQARFQVPVYLYVKARTEAEATESVREALKFPKAGGFSLPDNYEGYGFEDSDGNQLKTSRVKDPERSEGSF